MAELHHYLDGVHLLLLDLDGTVRECTVEGQPCPNRLGEQRLLPGAAEAILVAIKRGIEIVGVTNQGGIGLGYMTEKVHGEILNELRREISTATGYRFGMRVITCPHRPDAGCECRKPRAGMLYQAMGHSPSPEGVLFVGDKDTDEQAAEAVGVRFMDARLWRSHHLPVAPAVEEAGYDAAPLRYMKHGRETVDRMRDLCRETARMAGQGAVFGDSIFATLCSCQALKYSDRLGLKEGGDGDVKKMLWWTSMAQHIAGDGEDPRAGRAGFVSYREQSIDLHQLGAEMARQEWYA